MNAVVYLRISQDKDGERAGVQRQRAGCLELIECNGWNLVGVFEDNDQSAYRGKQREGWVATQQVIANGEADVLVAYAPDRLTRVPRELEDLIDLLESTGTSVATVAGGDYDLGTPEGRAFARTIGSFARMESEKNSARRMDANRKRALDGLPVKGRRAFGYNPDGMTLRESEAAVVRDMAHRVIAGESIRSLRVELNERGVTTSTGHTWSNARVGETLRNPRYAGLCVYRGEVVGRGVWEPVLDDETWNRLQAVLTQPGRRFRGGALVRWLTRVAVCGNCGEPLVAAQVSKARGASYTCGTDAGCSRLSVRADVFEKHIEGVMLAALKTPQARIRLVTDDVDPDLLAAIEADLDRIQNAIDRADTLHLDGKLDAHRWSTQTARLTAEQTAKRAERSTLLRSQTFAELPEGDVDAWWFTLTPTQKREVARLLFKSVTVKKARQLGGRIDYERFDLEWSV